MRPSSGTSKLRAQRRSSRSDPERMAAAAEEHEASSKAAKTAKPVFNCAAIKYACRLSSHHFPPRQNAERIKGELVRLNRDRCWVSALKALRNELIEQRTTASRRRTEAFR